jgi:hypothetical protein
VGINRCLRITAETLSSLLLLSSLALTVDASPALSTRMADAGASGCCAALLALVLPALAFVALPPLLNFRLVCGCAA